MKQLIKNFIIKSILSSAVLMACLFIFISSAKADDTPKNFSWFTNSVVQTYASDSTYNYFGGQYTRILNKTGSGFKITTDNQINNTTFPFVNGTIRVVEPDGAGGWIIAGTFNSAGDSARNGLAQINSDGSVSSFRPMVSGSTVYCLCVTGDDIYIGGTFTLAGGATRNRLAKFKISTSALDPTWNPNAMGSVNAMLKSGDSIYVGGGFSSIHGMPIRGLAKINTTDGTPFPLWYVSSVSTVLAMAMNENSIYVAGSFTSFNFEPRGKAAKVSKMTGDLDDDWNPNITGGVGVFSIAVSGTDVYVGGDFTTVGGAAKTRAAKLTGATGALDGTWNPNPNGSIINTITINGGSIYLGGTFSTAGGLDRTNAVKVNNINGAADPVWDIFLSSTVQKIAISGNDIYIGGNFYGGNGTALRYLARYNKRTLELDTLWRPDPNNYVASIAISGNQIFAAGQFTQIGGQFRNRLAKVNNTTGAMISWGGGTGPSNQPISSIALNGNSMYIAGSFTSYSGQTRNRLVKINALTGIMDLNWNPGADNSVTGIYFSGKDIYVCGLFATVGGLARNRIAKLDSATGAADDLWNPNANGQINRLIISGNDIFAGGQFTTIGGLTRNRLAKLDAATGLVDSLWNPNANNTVSGVAASGEDIYAVGTFTNIGGLARNRMAKLNYTTGAADANWNPNVSNDPTSVFVNGNNILIGGTFATVKNIFSQYFADLTDDTQTAAGNNVVAGNSFVSFNTESDTTAVSISINAGAGTGRINVYKYNDSAANSSGTAMYVSAYRWIIQQQGLAPSFTGQVKFKLSEIPNEPLGNPENIVVYSRPTPGSGNFAALPTTYDAGTGEITATVNSFSEFIFGSDDLLPVELSSFTSVVNGSNVKLEWSTVTEVNNSGFDIERKLSNENIWKKVGNVTGAGNSNEINNYNFTNIGLATGKYNYRLKQVDYNGNFEYFSLTSEVIIGIPSKFSLSQNYPNPFNPSTKINYELPKDNFVSLKIYDMTGKEVVSLVNEMKVAGYYTVNFNGVNLSSGIYFYSIKAGEFVNTKKMLLVK